MLQSAQDFLDAMPGGIEALVSAWTIPFVVCSREGEIVLGNAQGRSLWRSATRHWHPLAPEQALDHPLLDLRAYPTPVYSETVHHRIKLSALSEATLVEWLPLPGSERLDLLQEVSQAVNSSLIMEDIFDSLGDVLYRYIPFQDASIVILDDSQNGIKTLVRMQYEGLTEIVGENNVFAGSDPVVDGILKAPLPVSYPAEALPDSIVFDPEETFEVPGMGLVVPLVNKGVVIGLIAVRMDCRPHEVEAHQHLLVQVSEQLAVAVENAKFYLHTQAQAGREFLINQITKAINQSLDIDMILSTAVREIGKVTGVSRCFIHYIPPSALEGEHRVYQYCMPGIPPLATPQDPNASEQQAGAVLDLQVFELRRTADGYPAMMNPFILNDCRDAPPNLTDPAYFQQNNIQSMAVFPIMIKDKLVGTITLHQCDAVRTWLGEDIQLLIAICEHLGVALKQAQLFAELEQKKDALEQTLDELRQTQVQLIQSEKMAVLGQFVAGIAHEVNTPLGTISSNNATLNTCLERLIASVETATRDERQGVLFSTMQELLDLNKLASERIHEIVLNLRNFARLDESELQRVNLHEGIDSTLLVMRGSLPRNIKVLKVYSEELPLVECYPGLLNQVFMNILVNATHAMAGMETGQITIETAWEAEAGEVTVSFRDTGAGISPEHLSQLFDPGFTTKRRGLGTGLGLALCFRIVEKHHGQIRVESVLGEGSCFTVCLPVRQPAPHQENPKA